MNRPLRPCSYPGCGVLTTSGRCEKHQSVERERTKVYDKQRGTATQRGYDSKWTKASKAYLRENPLCAECERQGRVKPAQCVDHITPHKGDMALFWDKSNWQGLCFSCHSIKTNREDGGFGNAPSGKPSKACGEDGIPSSSSHWWNK